MVNHIFLHLFPLWRGKLYLIDGTTSQIITEFGPNLEERTTPASTFKIALSLMGYDKNILHDEHSLLGIFKKVMMIF